MRKSKAPRCSYREGTDQWCRHSTWNASGDCGRHTATADTNNANIPTQAVADALRSPQDVMADTFMDTESYPNADDPTAWATDNETRLSTEDEEHGVAVESHLIPRRILGVIEERVAGINRRARREVLSYDLHEYPEDSRYCLMQLFVEGDMETPYGEMLGAWDFNIDGEPLRYGKNITSSPPDRMECDHCGQRRRRNLVFVFQDDDGAVTHVGSTCMKDVKGSAWRNLLYYRKLGEIWRAEDVELGTQNGADARDFLIAAALAYIRTGRYVPTRQGDESNVNYASYLYATQGWGDELPYSLHESIAPWKSAPSPTSDFPTEEEWTQAADVVENALEWIASQEIKSDFDENMHKVADAEWLGPRSLGIASYVPVAYFKAKEREKPENTRTKPVPAGRNLHEGEVVKLDPRQGYMGETVYKATVRCEGYEIWGTVPSYRDEHGIRRTYQVGDRISFRAEVEPKELGFGFYSNPTVAKLIADNNDA